MSIRMQTRGSKDATDLARGDIHGVQLPRQGPVRAGQVRDDRVVGGEGYGVGGGAARPWKGGDVLERDRAIAELGHHIALLVSY